MLTEDELENDPIGKKVAHFLSVAADICMESDESGLELEPAASVVHNSVPLTGNHSDNALKRAMLMGLIAGFALGSMHGRLFWASVDTALTKQAIQVNLESFLKDVLGQDTEIILVDLDADDSDPNSTD